MNIPAQAVAAQVIQDGGSAEQAWVAAALVSGIESNGDPTILSGGIGPAAGLFQFEPGTWISNGGGAYASVAQDATWQDQVQVFVNASKGNNFGAWGPDLGNSYGSTAGPQPGSAVANKISSLAAGGTLASLLGNVPQSWADAGGTVAAPFTPNPLVNAPSGVAGVPSLSGLSGLETGIDTLLTDVTSADFWKRVGIFTGGGLLVIVGIIVFISTTKTGQKVESDAAVAAVA